jgi:hypothetical protein
MKNRVFVRLYDNIKSLLFVKIKSYRSLIVLIIIIIIINNNSYCCYCYKSYSVNVKYCSEQGEKNYGNNNNNNNNNY